MEAEGGAPSTLFKRVRPGVLRVLGFVSASSLFLPEDWQVACKPLLKASSDVSGFLRGAAMWISVLLPCGSPRVQCPSPVTWPLGVSVVPKTCMF